MKDHEKICELIHRLIDQDVRGASELIDVLIDKGEDEDLIHELQRVVEESRARVAAHDQDEEDDPTEFIDAGEDQDDALPF